MNINKVVNNDQLILQIEGRLDTLTAPNLESVINSVGLEVKELVIDMEKLEYVSSAGLRVILSAHKKMTRLGSMKIINVCENVMEVFEITGFSQILTIN